jgi:hypothetical protein
MKCDDSVPGNKRSDAVPYEQHKYHGEGDLLVARQYTQSTALLHASEVLLCFPHVHIDLVHPFFDAVQLL